MHNSLSRCRRHGVAAAIALALTTAATAPSIAAGPAGRLAQADMLDARVNLRVSYDNATAARQARLTPGRLAAERHASLVSEAANALARSLPGLDLRVSNLTGAPTSVGNDRGALTAPRPGVASDTIVREFLQEHAALYGLSAADLGDLTTLGDSDGGHSGLRMLRVEQRIDGRPVFESETRFVLDRDGRLFRSNGQFVPNARQQVDTFDPAALLSSGEAVAKLFAFGGEDIDAAAFSEAPGEDGRLTLTSGDAKIAGPVTARPVLFPLAPGVLVPAWSLVVFTAGAQDWYAVVDAETGDVLWRKNMREEVSVHDARFRVYVQSSDGVTPADNPAPLSPTNVVPGSGTQAAAISPTIVSMHTAMDPIASPNGWINDCPGGICTANETQTLGNNVVACLDRTGGGNANICDIDAASVLDGNGRPTGNPDTNGRNRDFLGTAPRDFQTNFLPPPQGGNPEAGQTATGAGASGANAFDQFRRGSVTQLFYVSNWYHDRLTSLGFDEAAGNFQLTNFSGMGVGNDRVLAEAQDSAGTNNANFATSPDGTSGRMQMFIFNGPTIDRDGSLDTEIVIHELTHGTSNRLVGNAAGLAWDPARGLGEGWSDFYALSLLNATNTDNPDASYASGSYATYKLAGAAFLDNYVYGIRRFPYSTNNSVNPMTWADVDDVTNNLSGGIPADPFGFNFGGGHEVHNSGELWALSLWEVRSRVIADPAGANGDVPTGNEAMLQLVTDAMKVTPNHPSFTEARDALIDADCAANACVNETWIWEGFADRGLGYGARADLKILGRYVFSHQGIGESFSLPYLYIADEDADLVLDDSASNNNGSLDPGEAVRLTAALTNPWRHASRNATGVTATLSTATPGVTIFDAAASYDPIAPQATGSAVTGDGFAFTVDPSVPCGSAIDFTLQVDSSLGSTSTTFRMRVGTPSGTDPVVTYTGDPNPDLTILSNQPRGVFHQINITDDFEIADLDFRIDGVTHPSVGDLTAMLRAPNGVGGDVVTLIDGLNDLGGASIVNMVIDDDVPPVAANDMVQATNAATPYTKSWLPVFNSPWAAIVNPALPGDTTAALARFDGMSTQGIWSAHVSDVWSATSGGTNGNGTFAAWSMLVTPVRFACTAFDPSPVPSTTKSVSGDFIVGGTVTYEITITNDGTSAMDDNAGDEFVDVLPAGLTFVAASASSGTATNAGNTVAWNGALDPLGDSVTITIEATIDAGTEGDTISNQGTVSFDADGNGSNESTLQTDDPGIGGTTDPTAFVVEFVDLFVLKTVTGTFEPNSNVTYVVEATNSGNVMTLDNAGFEMTDVLPAGLTLVSASAGIGTVSTAGNTVNWDGSVPAGGTRVITIEATIDANATGTISNQASFFVDTNFDGSNELVVLSNNVNAIGSDPTVFDVNLFANVSATKTVSGTFAPGDTVTYVVTARNDGNASAGDNAGNEVTDVLPAGLTLLSASADSGTASTAGNTVNWNGSIAAGADVEITITAEIDANATGIISNQANVSFDADNDGVNDTTVPSDDPGVGGTSDPTDFTVEQVSTDLAISKSNGTGGVPDGANTTYVIEVRNDGPLPVTGATIEDALPASLTDATWTCSAVNTTCPTPGDSGNVDLEVDLPVNAVITIEVTATVDGNLGDSIANTATVSVPAGMTDSDPSDNTATDTDVVPAIGIFTDGFED